MWGCVSEAPINSLEGKGEKVMGGHDTDEIEKEQVVLRHERSIEGVRCDKRTPEGMGHE